MFPLHLRCDLWRSKSVPCRVFFLGSKGASFLKAYLLRRKICSIYWYVRMYVCASYPISPVSLNIANVSANIPNSGPFFTYSKVIFSFKIQENMRATFFKEDILPPKRQTPVPWSKLAPSWDSTGEENRPEDQRTYGHSLGWLVVSIVTEDGQLSGLGSSGSSSVGSMLIAPHL